MELGQALDPSLVASGSIVEMAQRKTSVRELRCQRSRKRGVHREARKFPLRLTKFA
jgi:hypothetical protein